MSNDYTVEITPEAGRDLNGIYSYITYELKNQKAAEKLINEINDLITGLEDMPKKYPLSEINELREEEIRKCGVKNYIVLYSIDEDNKRVTVITVFYAMRDYRIKFFDD